ncbi:hypothetical protein V6N13_111734 [Hibiscus sabdariffa]
MPEEDLVELKFRLYDGSDIGPFRYSPASTVAMLKGRIVSEWPKDKKIAPKGANDIKLINSGKILENNKTVGQCRAPFDDLPKSVITMHVVVQPSATKANTGGRASAEKLLFVFRIRQRSHQLARQVWLGDHLLGATFPVTLARHELRHWSSGFVSLRFRIVDIFV